MSTILNVMFILISVILALGGIITTGRETLQYKGRETVIIDY